MPTYFSASAPSPSATASAVKRVGTLAAVDESLAERLLVADRQFLLLKLRELTYGTHVGGSCLCDFDDCGQRVSLNFSTADIPIKPLADKRAVYEYPLPAPIPGLPDPMVRSLALRLPTGADQEALCQVTASGGGAAQALRLLVQRLLVPGPGDVADPAFVVENLTHRALLGIEGFLAATAPAVDVEVRVTCAECHREFSVQLDIQDFFFGELWTTFSQPYRLSVRYSVSVVQIDPSSKSERPLPARVLHVGVPDVRAPFSPPDIVSVSPISGPAGSTVTVTGTALDGWRAYASISGRVIADAQAIAGSSFDLLLPGDLPTGFHELRIDVSHILRKTFFFEVTP
ncbi:MAG TPA: hypothetical protein VF524_04740 [Polyangia bacterium]